VEEPVADELSDETVRGLHADAVRLTRSNLVSAVLVWLLTLGLTAFTAVSLKSFFTMAVLAAGAASVYLVAVAKTWAALQRVDPQHFVRRETETHQRLREERNAHRLRWIATTPVATRTLMIVIGVLTAMQFVVLGLDERPSLRAAALVKSAVQQGEYWRMLSAGFLHLGAVHALGNLIGLMLLGRLIEAYARPLFVP